MKMGKFNISYEIITYESAENGEAEENGMYLENVTLREALEDLRWFSSNCEANEYPIRAPRWFSFYGDADIRTGDTENRFLHIPENVTPSSRRRIARLIGCYGA